MLTSLIVFMLEVTSIMHIISQPDSFITEYVVALLGNAAYRCVDDYLHLLGGKERGIWWKNIDQQLCN